MKQIEWRTGTAWTRALAVTTLVVTCLAWPASARAGQYDVHACDAAGGANNSWAPNTMDGALASYSACPSVGDPNRGIVTRNTVQPNGSLVAGGRGSQAFFHAPSGTSIVGMHAAYWFHREYSGYLVSLSNGSQVIKGCLAGGPPCDLRSPGEFIPTPPSSTIYIETLCASGPCPTDSTGDPNHAYLRARAVLYSASVRIDDPVGPSLGSVRGAFWGDGWKRGVTSVTFDASDNVGVRSSRVLVDDREVGARTKGCDYTLPAPCPQGGEELPVDTTALRGDGPHVARIQVIDAAGNVAETSRTVYIDNTAPDAPESLVVEGGEGWRSANDFDLSWKLPTQTVGSPIAGAEYELCPASGKDCKRDRADGRGLTGLKDLKVPAPGEYVLRLWLRDEAGNHDPRSAAPAIRLRYDDTSPDLAFEPLTAEDPTLVAVQTSDRGSGVTAGQIEMRRRGAARWVPMPTSIDGTRIVSRIDDEKLADGTFELRARGVDAGGNERSTEQRTDGSKAEFTLPLRLKTRMRAGVVRRAGRRARLAKTAFVRYGQFVRVRGRVSTPEGNPKQDIEVQAWTQVRDGTTPPRLIASVRTSRSGRFTFLVRKGPSRSIRIRYHGTNHIRSATRRLRLHVRARTTMRPNRRRLSNGETVRFRGRIRTGRIPERGKLVELQVRVRGKWRTFATARASRRGGWRYDYRFDGTRGGQTYRFRAKVPPEAGYPFATGRSRVVRVRVSGG